MMAKNAAVDMFRPLVKQMAWVRYLVTDPIPHHGLEGTQGLWKHLSSPSMEVAPWPVPASA